MVKDRLLMILEEIKNNQLQHGSDDDLWRIEDVARYMKTSEATARRSLAMDSAPVPVVVPGTNLRRWRAGDVRCWALQVGRGFLR